MADKGERTRQRIVAEALPLFSVKGYFNTSISDILSATQLTKGGLYCHFQSKEDIWYAVYDEAVRIWRHTVFRDLRAVSDPLERIQKTCDNVLIRYLEGEIFDGGCFFVNMLVELSGQSAAMSRHILKGFVGFAKLFQNWLKEADYNGQLRMGLDFKEVANFIVITLNGAATLFAASRDSEILGRTRRQLQTYLVLLRKDA
ncbi:MAG: TetR/AcrR family transcriptional regulator [Desulfobacterales bacterium]|nr:TetR/AcrR family transcriptional regulator [Desulfobacterales bacterium]